MSSRGHFNNSLELVGHVYVSRDLFRISNSNGVESNNNNYGEPEQRPDAARPINYRPAQESTSRLVEPCSRRPSRWKKFSLADPKLTFSRELQNFPDFAADGRP